MAITHPAYDVPALVLGELQDWCGQGWIARWDASGDSEVIASG